MAQHPSKTRAWPVLSNTFQVPILRMQEDGLDIQIAKPSENTTKHRSWWSGGDATNQDPCCKRGSAKECQAFPEHLR